MKFLAFGMESIFNTCFSTSTVDRPLIVQFAAKNPEEFASAAEMIAPDADGVDLNCGCPQRSLVFP